MKTKWESQKNVVLCNRFLETELIPYKGKLIKAGNTPLKIGNETDNSLYA